MTLLFLPVVPRLAGDDPLHVFRLDLEHAGDGLLGSEGGKGDVVTAASGMRYFLWGATHMGFLM